MLQRRKLGSVYVKSPAQHIRTWMGGYSQKFIVGIASLIGFYFLFNFMIVGVINFLRKEIAGEDTPLSENFWLPVLILCQAGILIYIFKDKPTSR